MSSWRQMRRLPCTISACLFHPSANCFQILSQHIWSRAHILLHEIHHRAQSNCTLTRFTCELATISFEYTRSKTTCDHSKRHTNSRKGFNEAGGAGPMLKETLRFVCLDWLQSWGMHSSGGYTVFKKVLRFWQTISVKKMWAVLMTFKSRKTKRPPSKLEITWRRCPCERTILIWFASGKSRS